MKLLLDESVPKALGFLLAPHFVRSAQIAGFAGLLNGELLNAMAVDGYDVLITFDQNLPYQQNTNLPVFVYVLKAKNNRVETAIQFAPLIIAALEAPLLQRLLVIELPI
jgi:hypothetical protein